MLAVPLIVSLITACFKAFGGIRATMLISDEIKASLNGLIDWDNSIYIIGTNNEVSHEF
jgi:hypothetical protein